MSHHTRCARSAASRIAIILLATALPAFAWAPEGSTWPGPSIPVVVQMGPLNVVLKDGSLSWNAVVENAMALWNEQMLNAQFFWREADPNPSVPYGGAKDGNGTTEISFQTFIYGEGFGSRTLAVTLVDNSGSQMTECDVLFNQNIYFNSYRGRLQVADDLHRVALHELGHVLGLDHPDENHPAVNYTKQTVAAVMNSQVSDLDHLVADDIAGVQALYGAPPNAPAPTGNSRIANISTRVQVNTRNAVMIGGFIVQNATKRVLLRALGPSIPLAGTLANPYLELHGADGQIIAANDDWRSDASQAEAIAATNIPPPNDRESAILANLSPGSYTAIVRGADNGSGLALVEVYDLSIATGRLANISTRGQISTGDNAMIGGFIVDPNRGPQSKNVVVRGIGPSLVSFVAGAISDPTIELRNGNGELLQSNARWVDSRDADAIYVYSLAPTNNNESAIIQGVVPGNYTVVLRSVSGATGIALVEVYDID
ncbi:MAG: matrixin family metalloprotease [Chthoniobacterales bacterium]